ncbi:MAG TPA: flagellar hook-length control protein FliK [Stellaceae bacterium]|jgi:hypothetical protein|nr:flagellar hook-length control protein FliK [Stellaceae bacterium]
MPARAAASPRGADDSSPADAFAAALGAAALGAAAPKFQPHRHSPAGSDDASAGGDPAGDAPAATSDHAKATAPSGGDRADAISDTEKTTLVMPGLRAWFAPSTGPAPSRQRGPSGPTAADASVNAAAAVAAALVAPTVQQAGAPGPSGVKPSDRAPSIAPHEGLPGPLSADVRRNPQAPVSGLPAPGDKAGPAGLIGSGSGVEPVAAKPHFAPTEASAGPDPAQLATGDPTALPTGSIGDPSTMSANLSGPPLIHAAVETPAPTAQFNTAALTAAVPSAVVPALTDPASAGGHDSRDSSGRDSPGGDGRAAETVALGGVGAATGTGAASESAGLATGASGVTGGADPGAAGVANQLSGQVLRLLANSGHEALVRLHPPDLGEVTVRVAVSGRDVSAWFGASQPAVQQTISLGLGQLQTDLGNAGYNLSGAWVGADTLGFGARDGTARRQPSFSGAIAAAPPASTGAAAALSSGSGVSIYV